MSSARHSKVQLTRWEEHVTEAEPESTTERLFLTVVNDDGEAGLSGELNPFEARDGKVVIARVT